MNREKGIAGKDVTPYVLERVNRLSDGSSLKANIALIENNARIGAKICLQYQRLRAGSTDLSLKALNPTNSLDKNFKDVPNITNDSNRSQNMSKGLTESIPESRLFGPTERNDDQSEQLSPVRCFQPMIRFYCFSNNIFSFCFMFGFVLRNGFHV